MYDGFVFQARVCTARGQTCGTASHPHLDLNRSPYVLYGVKHIDLVSLCVLSRPQKLRNGLYVRRFDRALVVLNPQESNETVKWHLYGHF